MNKAKLLFAVIAFAFALVGCSGSGGGDDGTDEIISIDNLSTYLASQPANTKDNPYSVNLKITDISQFTDLAKALNNNPAKYVYLDLSDTMIASIPNKAFENCASLTGVTMGNFVTRIGSRAFANCTSLTGVTMPDNVTIIGNGAFANCTSLTSVSIPGNVATIEHGAFSGCKSLTRVTIPNSVTIIEEEVFNNCNRLTIINVAANNSAYASIDGVVYNKNKTTIIVYPAGKRGDFAIPDIRKTARFT